MERQIERVRESEPGETGHDQDMKWKAERFRQKAEGLRLIREDDQPWEQTRQAYTKRYIWAGNWDKVAMPGWIIFRHRIFTKGGRHVHQGGVGLFILEGKGYSIVDGVKREWEKDDLVMLPLQPGGCDHQHFNEVQGGYSEWIAFIYQPFQEIVGDVYIQKEFHPDYQGPKVAIASNLFDEEALARAIDGRKASGGQPAAGGYFGDLLRTRDREREQLARARIVIQGRDLPVENNPLGLYRWYLHPSMTDIPTKAIIAWTVELPPGSQSGKQRSQGGRGYYVLDGKGYTVLDGQRYDWKQGDLMCIPHKVEGSEYQFFNADSSQPARLYAVEFNWSAALGVDMGSGFDVLENSPDYKP
ncbi:MAG: cupin domain-containing protein [Dehalococcoidia bacterium]